jgi:hypothetical protein
MARGKIIAAIGLVVILALVSSAQTNERREGGPPPTVVMPPQPQLPVGPGLIPPMRMRELADQLRARAQEAQELSDRLRRQADELDQMAKRMMDRGPGPGPQQMDQTKRELDTIKEAIGRAEREGRRQEADELRRRAEQLMGRFQPMPPGPRMDERQEIKGQIERLRNEAQKAKDEGRVEDSKNIWQEAQRLEQELREQGPRKGGEFGGPMPPEVQDILRSAEQAQREGRMEDARRQREKADMVARPWQEQRGNRELGQPGPRGDERQEMKRKIEDLRNEAQKAKDQGRGEDADRLWKEADRLEQQLREPGPREKGEFGKPMPPEVQDILRAAEQAEREGRMDDARRQREKAQMVARELGGQKGQGPESPDRSFKDEIVRSMEGLKKEIGRLWQAVNEMRNRPREDRPM